MLFHHYLIKRLNLILVSLNHWLVHLNSPFKYWHKCAQCLIRSVQHCWKYCLIGPLCQYIYIAVTINILVGPCNKVESHYECHINLQLYRTESFICGCMTLVSTLVVNYIDHFILIIYANILEPVFSPQQI